MATNTPKYGFKKPDKDDFYNIDDQNGNWDKTEEVLKTVEEEVVNKGKYTWGDLFKQP